MPGDCSGDRVQRADWLYRRGGSGADGIVFGRDIPAGADKTTKRDVSVFSSDLFDECVFLQRGALHLELVGFPEKFFGQSPFELSGGQKRRVAIAGVLAMEPDILVLDEPTAGLDPKGRDEILGQISHLQKETGISVVLVSHSMEDVANYVERIIVMNKGKVMFDDVPHRVFSHVKELEAVGLAAPQVTYILHQLKDNGFDVDPSATTIEEAKETILQAVRKNSK